MEYGPQEVVVEQMSKLNSVSSMHGAFAKLMKSSISGKKGTPAPNRLILTSNLDT